MKTVWIVVLCVTSFFLGGFVVGSFAARQLNKAYQDMMEISRSYQAALEIWQDRAVQCESRTAWRGVN